MLHPIRCVGGGDGRAPPYREPIALGDSATAALGANIGALGFAGSSAAPTAVVAPVTATQPATATPVVDQTAVAKPRTGEHEGAERARTQPVAPTSAPRGEGDD